MEKSNSFHSVIVPANHIDTIECFINEGKKKQETRNKATRKQVILLCVIYVVVQFDFWFNLDFLLFLYSLSYVSIAKNSGKFKLNQKSN